MGYSLWGHKESDMTERLTHTHIHLSSMYLGPFIDIPHFIVLEFIVLQRYCMFYKLKVCGNRVWSKSVGAIFPKAFAHFVSLCHILVILITFHTFLHYYIYYDSL